MDFGDMDPVTFQTEKIKGNEASREPAISLLRHPLSCMHPPGDSASVGMHQRPIWVLTTTTQTLRNVSTQNCFLLKSCKCPFIACSFSVYVVFVIPLCHCLKTFIGLLCHLTFPQISLTVLEILGTLPSSLEFWFSMEDSHLEKSAACRYMLQPSLAAQLWQHVGVFAEQIECWDSNWFLPGMTSKVQDCAGQLAQLLPSGRSITDLSSTSDSGRGKRLICGYPAWPQWTCSFCTCGQVIQSAIQMVTKGSLHPWVLPFHHHAA